MGITDTSLAINQISLFKQKPNTNIRVLIVVVKFQSPVFSVATASATLSTNNSTFRGEIQHTANAASAIFGFEVAGYQMEDDGKLGSGDFVFTVGIVPRPGQPVQTVSSNRTTVQPIEIDPCRLLIPTDPGNGTNNGTHGCIQ